MIKRIEHKQEQPLISIVVPIYKVERYLDECICSILNQSYEKLEILLVDDGSPDHCGEICDAYANGDSRIRVIHQSNQGLAETRNIGKNLATGEYLYYLDSDDYIEPDTIEIMVQKALETGADIVVGGFYMEYVNGEKKRNNSKDIILSLNSKEALGLYLYSRYINPIACGKLYRTELLDNVSYPKGRLYEDMATTYQVIAKAHKVIFCSYPFYHYVQRSSSIGKIANKELNKQLEQAVDEYWDYISDCAEIRDKAFAGRAFWHLVAYNRMICAGDKDDELYDRLKDEIEPLKIMGCKYTSLRKKIQLLLFKFCPSLYVNLYQKYFINKSEKMSE